SREGVRRNEIAVAREIADDGVGLREPAAVLEIHRRHLSEGVELEKLRGPAAAAHGVDLDPAIGEVKMIAHPLHLQAIAGIAVAENFHAAASFQEATEQQAKAKLSTVTAAAERLGLRTCSPV